jgi:AraC-like DNA-binding protein
MEGHPTISLAAEIAGMSTRTLQRQLSKAGMPYEQLVDQLRCRLALRYLEEHDASLGEIAFNLGYSEQSAFSRAFTRWTGISPRDHRRNLQANAVN